MVMINRLRVTRMVALATSIGTSALLANPGWAFTLSSSEATFNLNHFSALPLDVTALQDANTQAIAPDGSVNSNANAKAIFLTDAANQASSQANGFSSSVVSGSGNSYSGLAQSVAQVTGDTFRIGSGETFSFAFNTSLNLKTSIDQPDFETASAIGTISLGLYDAADPTNLMLLDFLTIASSLDTSGNNVLTVNQSTGITFSARQTTLESFSGGKQASASVQGSLSRSFTRPTALTLVEYGLNKVSAAAVPEPSSVLAPLVCLGLLGIRWWRKPKPNPKP